MIAMVRNANSRNNKNSNIEQIRHYKKVTIELKLAMNECLYKRL